MPALLHRLRIMAWMAHWSVGNSYETPCFADGIPAIAFCFVHHVGGEDAAATTH
ncbi:MAG: hypothetical protein IJJ33_01160 [Victivallales bacterium]|nr:hypothetical protein [Victivallales bacterium]